MVRDELSTWIALSLATELGPRTARFLLDTWGSPGAIFKASRHQLAALGLERSCIDRLLDPELRKRAERELRQAESLEVRILTLHDPVYPALLKQLFDPPLLLYCRGNPEALSQAGVALVGSRKPTTYGIHAAEHLAADLADCGLSVVSGLARGIDAAGHRGALSVDGVTVAVLGNGLDVLYPREHEKLARSILVRGAWVSEFPLGTFPAPQNFPIRNRIISGLALGTIIVEAAEHSGSLITARLALDQNRELFAVPGNITSAKSFGPNYLIKQGAKLVQTWRDVVEELPRDIQSGLRLEEKSGPAETSHREPLSSDEERIYKLLSIELPQHVDALAGASLLDMGRLNEILLALEMKELVRQLPGKNFVRR